MKNFSGFRTPFYRFLLIVFCVFLLPFVMFSSASATFDEQMAVCARSVALSNTCTADPPGILAIHYNPAGLSSLDDGKTLSLSFIIGHILLKQRLEADPDFDGYLGGYGPNATDEDKRDPLAGTEGTTGSQMYLPIYNNTIPLLAGGPLPALSTREKDSKWTFAVGAYMPYGAGFTHEDSDDPIRFQAKSLVSQYIIYAAPSASYKINDDLSFGLSIGMGQAVLQANLDMRLPSDMTAITRILGEATQGLEIPIISELTLPSPWFGGGVSPYDKIAQLSMKMRDDYSPSYNLGVLWSPKKWLSLGATYQSEIKLEMTGRYSIQHSPQFSAMMSWLGQGVVTPIIAGMLNLPTTGEDQYGYCSYSSHSYPQRIQAGIKLQPIKQFKFLFDTHWSDWSIFKEDRFVFDQQLSILRFANINGYSEPANAMVIRRNFKSTFHWSTGVELIPNDWLTLRAGYEMRPTSVRPDLYDAMYALPDLENIGVGLGITFNNGLIIDLGLAYIHNDSYTVPNNSSTNMNSIDWTRPVYNPFGGLDYFQETKIYIGSASLTMPWELMMSMSKRNIDKVKNVFSSLNPFD